MAASAAPIKVAVASDFLTAFSQIPRKQQGKVLDFVNKFRSDPSLGGIQYEKIQKAKDPNLRSVRIDKSYRGVILKPDTGNVYVLLWVDHHDKAYEWAENKVYKIHPETGSLQVINVNEAEQADESIKDDSETARVGLFASISDRSLLRLGVPDGLVKMVKSLKTMEDLDKTAKALPEEAYEALFFLAEGYTLEEVLGEFGRSEPAKEVDKEDFGSALEKPDSKRRFWVVEDELELEAMLYAPLEKWRVFLHPSQRNLVERDWSGPVRVLGGAGTGKTVVAMHRAKWLAQKRFSGPNDRILFTTFTRNLAADIKENLTKICGAEAMRRIEVVNLDKWVSDFLRRNGYDSQIDYGRRSEELWEKALDMAPAHLDLDSSFYRDEWESVVQPQEISSLNEYIKASRIGRGIRLSRKARKDVWPVFEEYRLQMNDNGLKEPDDAMRDARLILENKGDILPYKAVIVDEAQDMGPQAFKLIRQIMRDGDRKNDLFIVGDAHQRIYRHKIVLSHCGIRITGRSKKLFINYRTTDETRKWAVNLLQGMNIDDLDGGTDDQKGYKSLLRGIAPTVRTFGSFEEEVDFIGDYLHSLKKDSGELKDVCLVARTNDLVKQYDSALKEKKLKTYVVRRSEPEDRTKDGVRLATMHRVKGLEFDRVIITAVNDGIVPYSKAVASTSDAAVRKESETRERALLYVSATRAKKEAVVTSFGQPSPFLPPEIALS
ncbi:UvrD-helicase domain-containing protein [Thermodesulfobacteriota bacterium]